MILLQSDIGLFIGRLHPLVVHLPIGFLLLAAVFFYFGRKDKYTFLNKALPISLALTAISSIAAVIFGWLLADGGGYNESALFWHRWLGISFALLITGVWLWCVGVVPPPRLSLKGYGHRWKRLWQAGDWIDKGKNLPVWIMAIVIVLISITGHLGGILTHGQGYFLKHAPSFMQKIFETQGTDKILAELPIYPDSVLVFHDIISPILEAKCGNCHNESQHKGGLNVVSVSGIEEGGDDGKVLVKNKPFESEILLRTTMPPGHTKFMPPKGTPLSFSEIELLKWWINSGASFELRLTALESNSILATLLKRDYGLDPKAKPVYEMIAAKPASNDVIEELENNGLIVRQIYKNSNYLDISVSPELADLSVEKLRAVLSVSDQVTWLDLSKAGIRDEHMEIVGQLEKLTLLRINSNDISDKGLPYLNKLKYLESLNLYNTKVSDNGLIALQQINTLKRVYLWQTKVTPDGASKLREKLPNLAIDLGLN